MDKRSLCKELVIIFGSQRPMTYAIRHFTRGDTGFYINNNITLSYTQSKQIDEQGNVLANHYLNYTNDIDKEKWKAPIFEKASKKYKIRYLSKTLYLMFQV